MVKSKTTSIALAGAFGLVLMAGPAVSQTYDAIELRVPVKLKNMHPNTKLAVVNCQIWGTEIIIAQYGSVRTIANGKLDEVVPVVVRAPKDGTFVSAKSAVCSLFLSNNSDPQLGYEPAVKGTPPSADIWRLGKPDEYFLQTFRVPLDGGKLAPGISRSKELTIQPKQKE